jgi:hypothetical protein
VAETPFPVADQLLLDQQNDASYRVCADTRCLTKRATFPTVIGQREYALAADVARVISVSTTSTVYAPITTDAALRYISGLADVSSTPRYYMLGPNIGFQPVPASIVTITIYYQARPAALSALGGYEIGGDFARLIDRRANCNLFDDDGQIGLAAAEEAFYRAESQRLLRRRRTVGRTRVPVLGYDVDV